MQASPEVAELIGQIYDAALDARRWRDFTAQLPGLIQAHVGLALPADPQDSEAIFRFFGLDEDVQQVFETTAESVQRRYGNTVPFAASSALSQQASAQLALLLGHLRSGLALHRRLSRAERLAQATAAALESAPFGVVVLDGDGAILHANGQAKSMAAVSGLLRVPPAGMLRCTRLADDTAFQALLAGALHTASGGTSHTHANGGSLRLGMAGGPQLHALVAALPAARENARHDTAVHSTAAYSTAGSAVAVFLSDPQARIGSLALILRNVYDMTPAEAALTEALVNGSTPAEYAQARSLSMSTIRTQVRTAAAKAGASRQADLIRIVLTGPAVLRHVG